MAERKYWELLADSEHQRLVFVWASLVLTVLALGLGVIVVRLALKPREVVVVPGAAAAGLYPAGGMPRSVIVDFARNFVVDLSNFTPASAEKSFLSAARYMAPALLGRFEPAARVELKSLVDNRVSELFTISYYSIEGGGPFRVTFVGERTTYVGRTETDRKPYEFKVTLERVESTNENPYGLLVTGVTHGEYRKGGGETGESQGPGPQEVGARPGGPGA